MSDKVTINYTAVVRKEEQPRKGQKNVLRNHLHLQLNVKSGISRSLYLRKVLVVQSFLIEQ